MKEIPDLSEQYYRRVELQAWYGKTHLKVLNAKDFLPSFNADSYVQPDCSDNLKDIGKRIKERYNK